ncbi:MAG: hypothetical protein ACJ76Z_00930 [Thermoleophilaceae bacterium]
MNSAMQYLYVRERIADMQRTAAAPRRCHDVPCESFLRRMTRRSARASRAGGDPV